MSITRVALGLAAVAAITVIYSGSRSKHGSTSTADDAERIGMGSTPGTDRESGGSEARSNTGSSSAGFSAETMSGGGHDDLLSPSATRST